LELFEEVNVSCITGVPTGRALTVPSGLDENDTAALNTVFSSVSLPGFFDGVDLSGA
jgi:hypothetical protein